MYQLDQNQDAYREGLFARALGRSCDDNPYPEHSGEASLWIHGWWLIQDATGIAPAVELEHDSPGAPPYFPFEDLSPYSFDEREDQLSRSLSLEAVEAVLHLLRGLLIAAAGFSLSYVVLRVFLL